MSNEPKRDELSYIFQKDIINGFISNIGQKAWQSVCFIPGYDESGGYFTIFSALLENHVVKKALERDNWDLVYNDCLPDFTQVLEGEKQSVIYHRFGIEGIRPLVIYRIFNSSWLSHCLELCEEFRHFHNLAEDYERKSKILLDFDESGYEIKVAEINEHEIQVNWRYLQQFLAATQLHLAIYFGSLRYSLIPLEEIPEKDKYLQYQKQYQNRKIRYCMYIGKCDFWKEYRTFSRLFGKVIITPPPIEQCGKWPFKEIESEPEVDFIVGINSNGEPIECTSNQKDYMNRVYFRREVLGRYYDDPERYSVEDHYLRCLDSWGIPIDNHNPDYVAVLLGDLGHLPYNEKLHWKSFNIPPSDVIISETYSRHDFPARSSVHTRKSPDLVFRRKYQELNKAWSEKIGWPLFLDLKPEDKLILKSIRIPVTNSQSELDQQVGRLTILMVDSLNEKKIVEALNGKICGEKGISKFERFLKNKKFKNTKKVIKFLRDLQKLRSHSFAHRKGDKYKKILVKLGIEGKRGQDIMKLFFTRAIETLEILHNFLIDNISEEKN